MIVTYLLNFKPSKEDSLWQELFGYELYKIWSLLLKPKNICFNDIILLSVVWLQLWSVEDNSALAVMILDPMLTMFGIALILKTRQIQKNKQPG